MEEEYKKLKDLEFEYNLARMSGQEEDIIKVAKMKYFRQLKKFSEMQKQEKEEVEESIINLM